MVPLQRRELLASVGIATLAGCTSLRPPGGGTSGVSNQYPNGWPQAGFDARNSRNPEHDSPQDSATERWRFERETVGFLFDEPAVAVTEDDVIVGTVDGTIFTIDIESGESSRLVSLSSSAYRSIAAPIRGIASTGESLYVTSDGLYKLDRTTGDDIWHFAVDPEDNQANLLETNPTISDDSVYIPGYGVHALDRETGEQQWHFKTDGLPDEIDPAEGDISWFVPRAPAVTSEQLFCSTYGSTLYAIDRDTGEESWRYDTATREMRGTPVTQDGIVYQHMADRVYAFDASTGDIEWDTSLTDYQRTQFELAPALTDDRLYLGVSPVLGFDIQNGETDWIGIDDPTGFGRFTSPVVTSDMLYTTDLLQGHLYAFSLDDEGIAWNFEESSPQGGENCVITTEDLVCYLTTRGDLIAFESGTT